MNGTKLPFSLMVFAKRVVASTSTDPGRFYVKFGVLVASRSSSVASWGVFPDPDFRDILTAFSASYCATGTCSVCPCRDNGGAFMRVGGLSIGSTVEGALFLAGASLPWCGHPQGVPLRRTEVVAPSPPALGCKV